MIFDFDCYFLKIKKKHMNYSHLINLKNNNNKNNNNREIDTNHSITHFSKNIQECKLNFLNNLFILGDLVENIYLSFPNNYNDFCKHSNYPLNCIQSVTVRIKSYNKTIKIVYYPSSTTYLSLVGNYNVLEYINIDNQIISIPKPSNIDIYSKNITKNIDVDVDFFVSSFFQDQKVIICPLKIKINEPCCCYCEVSIQRQEENLLVENNIIPLLHRNLKNIISLYVSDPIYSKPIPTLYIGTGMFNKNTTISDHILKNKSLDNVSIDSILEERKLWSNYNELIKTKQKDKDEFHYIMDQNSYDDFCCYLFFVCEMDLNNINEIILKIGGNVTCCFDGLWLQTRYEEYKLNINQNLDFLKDNYVLLPLPLIYKKNIISQSIEFIIKIKTSPIDPPLIYYKNKKDQDNKKNLPTNNCMETIVQCNYKNITSYRNEISSELLLNCNIFLCEIWCLVTYKGNICLKTDLKHPFSKLKLINHGLTILEGSADYYHKIIPLFFEQPTAQKYLIYRMIFDNNPLSFSYPVAKNSYEPGLFISNQSYHSIINIVDRRNEFFIKVYWDEEVIKQHYPETDQLKLYFFSESLNLLSSLNGESFLKFSCE